MNPNQRRCHACRYFPAGIICSQCRTPSPEYARQLEAEKKAREIDQVNRYAEAGIRREIAARYTGRPDHDTGPAGQKMKG